MATKINMGRDISGFPINQLVERSFSDSTALLTLAADSETTITCPEDAQIACFSYSTGTSSLPAVIVSPTEIPGFNGNNILTEDGFNLLLEDGDNLLLEGGSITPGAYLGISLNPEIRTVKENLTLYLANVGDATVYIGIDFFNRTLGGLIGVEI